MESSALTSLAEGLVPRVIEETVELVALSTPSGEQGQTEAAVSLCVEFMPEGAQVRRLPCSTTGCVPDLLASIRGGGARRLLLLGHVDTVFSHSEHRAPHRDGDRIYGSGAIDMKGGVAVALAVARAMDPESYAELTLLLVTDEEWRSAPFRHVERFTGYDACLCFEAGEVDENGADGVVVQRKGAGTLRIVATGRASHSGSAPQEGRNALLALAHAAIEVAAVADPDGEDRLTVVPTVITSGGASNVVPASGELVIDTRAADTGAFRRVVAAVPAEVGGARLEPVLERVWPAMNSRAAAAPVLAAAGARLGRGIVARSRGGASDASHLAAQIPVTIDGLGPRGGGAHTPGEFLHVPSLAGRIGVALAIAQAAAIL
jgi:glutamate carboxypeptidase